MGPSPVPRPGMRAQGAGRRWVEKRAGDRERAGRRMKDESVGLLTLSCNGVVSGPSPTLRDARTRSARAQKDKAAFKWFVRKV